MKIRNLMSTDVAHVNTIASLGEAADVMRKHDCGFLVVLDASSNALEGVVTDRDICMSAAAKDVALSEIDVADAMKTHVRTVAVDDTVATAYAMMRRYGIRRLPVMDGDNVAGVISMVDIAGELIAPDAIVHVSKAGAATG